MKKLVSGIVIGVCLSSAVVYAAENLNVVKVAYKVFVNEKELQTDLPILNYSGRTYLPLKAVGDALGVKVNWDEQSSSVKVGEPKPQENQPKYGYSNPAPLNTIQTITVKDLSDTVTAEMKVTEIIRGAKALEMIKAANQFNSDPKEGHEYLLAKIYFKVNSCEKGNYTINNFLVKSISTSGKEYDTVFPVSPEPKFDSKLYPGASVEGWSIYEVSKDDVSPKLAYGRDYNGSGGIWFKAY
jgi:hypothetical protein